MCLIGLSDCSAGVAVMETEYQAVCYDCTWIKPWTLDFREAEADRDDHSAEQSIHKVIVQRRVSSDVGKR